APKADIIVVKMNLNRPDNEFLSSLVDAIKYIFDRADEIGEPAVINISLGTYFGSHDGKDIQAQSIDNLISSKPGRVVVCSAGNAGTAPLHLTNNVTSDTNFTWLQFSSQSIYIQAWGDSANFENIQFSLGIDRVNHGYTTLKSLPFNTVNYNLGVLYTDTLSLGGNQFGIIQGLNQFWNGNYSVEFLITPDSTLNITSTDTSRYLWRFMTTGNGHYDGWSYDMVFDNLPDSVSYPPILKYKKPDTDQTIVSSFTCSDKVITVGSYINRNFYTNANYAITRDTNLVVGQLSLFSSHGPTRDGRIKPDITATGEWLISCGTQSELNLLAAIEPEKVAAGKKHKRSSGTSMSSPVVAGIAALYLQKNPTARWDEVKNAIINCADEDAFTGNNLPDNRWGYGKINAYAAVKGCTVGIDDLDATSGITFQNYPNPFESNTTIAYDMNILQHVQYAEIVIADVVGSVLQRIQIKDKVNAINLSKGKLAAGMYNCSLIIDGKTVRTNKLVIL
ncbi:MAG TPA: S8 family serine peptidase, partial [Bacteroidia bacterium]|nr:S8 family serine peptidase [Bacteroidia bacterium]